MDKLVLVDKKSNGASLKQYLVNQSSDFAEIGVFEKKDVFAEPRLCTNVRYLFSTWNMPVLSEEEIASQFPSLEAIFYAAGDVSYFSAPFKSRGVKVFSAQRENSIPVAEFVLAQVLLSNKGFFQSQDEYRKGFWRLGFRKARALSRGRPGNFGAKIGIIGLGTIGSLLAEMLKPFELEVVVHDPFVTDDQVRILGAARVSLEELFETSDVISNHLPDIVETRGLLDYHCFSMMKSDATFINTGRGRQVDEKGLVKALRECPSRSALLDVTCSEPPKPFSEIYRTRNIFLSPHIAGSQGNEINRLYHASLRQYLEFRES